MKNGRKDTSLLFAISKSVKSVGCLSLSNFSPIDFTDPPLMTISCYYCIFITRSMFIIYFPQEEYGYHYIFLRRSIFIIIFSSGGVCLSLYFPQEEYAYHYIFLRRSMLIIIFSSGGVCLSLYFPQEEYVYHYIFITRSVFIIIFSSGGVCLSLYFPQEEYIYHCIFLRRSIFIIVFSSGGVCLSLYFPQEECVYHYIFLRRSVFIIIFSSGGVCLSLYFPQEEYLTGRKYTYAQLKEAVVRVASALYRRGYRKGDVLLVFAVNNVDFTVLTVACAAAGVWFCPANPSYTAGTAFYCMFRPQSYPTLQGKNHGSHKFYILKKLNFKV